MSKFPAADQQRYGTGMLVPSNEVTRADRLVIPCRSSTSGHRSDSSSHTRGQPEAGSLSRLLAAQELLLNVSKWVLQTVEEAREFSLFLNRLVQRGHSHTSGPRAGSGNGTRSRHSLEERGHRTCSSSQRVWVLQPLLYHSEAKHGVPKFSFGGEAYQYSSSPFGLLQYLIFAYCFIMYYNTEVHIFATMCNKQHKQEKILLILHYRIKIQNTKYNLSLVALSVNSIYCCLCRTNSVFSLFFSDSTKTTEKGVTGDSIPEPRREESETNEFLKASIHKNLKIILFLDCSYFRLMSFSQFFLVRSLWQHTYNLHKSNWSWMPFLTLKFRTSRRIFQTSKNDCLVFREKKKRFLVQNKQNNLPMMPK